MAFLGTFGTPSLIEPYKALVFPAFSGSLLGSGQGPPQDLAGFGKAEGRALGFIAYGWKTLNPKHLSPPNSRNENRYGCRSDFVRTMASEGID